MKVELFALCDAATNYHGKLNILGTFDSLWTKEMPFVYPRCAIALRLRFSKIEEGNHTIKIAVIDADGNSVANPFETNAKIDFSQTPFNSVSTNMILNFQGLNFNQFGEYAIDLSVDGRHESTLPLYVSQVPEEGQQ